MSSQADITPLILDLFEFLDALGDLKRASKRCDTLKTSDGRTHKVEATFQDALGREAGLQKTEKGYTIITDCHGLTTEEQKKQTESVQQIIQRYAQKKVLKQLMAEGYVVAEEQKQQDGSIKMLVRKWSV